MFLLKDCQYLHCVFLKYTQNSLEYLIQNMIPQVIQIYQSMLELRFKFIVIIWGFYVFPCIVNTKFDKATLFFFSNYIYNLSMTLYIKTCGPNIFTIFWIDKYSTHFNDYIDLIMLLYTFLVFTFLLFLLI